MNTYTVTLRLPNREAFMKLVDEVGPLVHQLVITVAAPEQAPAIEESKPAPQRTRVSKVNDTITTALKNGPQTVKQLKEALEGAELSAGSLSTGIAALKKAGEIANVAEGVYALASMQQAAE